MSTSVYDLEYTPVPPDAALSQSLGAVCPGAFLGSAPSPTHEGAVSLFVRWGDRIALLTTHPEAVDNAPHADRLADHICDQFFYVLNRGTT